jgi:hypothetical protein
VLAIAAHIPSAEIGGNYFQETHTQELFRECSVYCELASTAGQFPFVLDIAVRSAVERRGVAVLVIPGDVLLQSLEHVRRSGSCRGCLAARADRPACVCLHARSNEPKESRRHPDTPPPLDRRPSADRAARVGLCAGLGQLTRGIS